MDEAWAQGHVWCGMCDWRNYLIAVSLDETWMKHGHKSMYGVACVIELNTGLVIDYHVMSKYSRGLAERGQEEEEENEQH